VSCAIAAGGEAWETTPPPLEIQASGAPIIPHEPVPRCPVCESAQFHELAVGFDYELRTCRNPWRFVRCDACGHAWLHPRPRAAELSVIYPPHYYAYNYEEQVSPLARWGKDLLDRMKFAAILQALDRRPRAYLDVGCGSGRYLRLLERSGVPRERLYGLELDESAVGRLRAEGYPVSAQRVEEATELPEATLDLVTMFHVIEHVGDVRAVVERVVRWLAPGGVFAVETPNLESLDARLFGARYWGGYHIPRHWHVFTLASLSRLLRDSGLEVTSVRYQTGHSFWMYSVHHWLRYGARPSPRLARWFDPLHGLSFLIGFTGWDKLRASLGFATSAMLVLGRKAQASGEPRRAQ
jgi:SAM-dependent methyltransferase